MLLKSVLYSNKDNNNFIIFNLEMGNKNILINLFIDSNKNIISPGYKNLN